MRNCVDIVRPFTEALGDRENVQLIGGIGSAALSHPGTIIVPGERRIIAPSDLQLPQYRPDGNLRDFDVLVLSTDREQVDEIEDIARQTIGNELELSVFDLRPIDHLPQMQAHPLRALKQFVSDRYAYEDERLGVRVVRRALFPFQVKMDLDTLGGWRLYVGEKDPYPAPVPHPGTVILNYLTRSISGLRAKDESKVAAMSDAIITKDPTMRDWMIDGPGNSQMEFARILQRLSRPGELAVGQHLTVTPVSGNLSSHTAFMLPDSLEAIRRTVLDISYAKARGTRFFEQQDWIVTLWQRHMEGRVDSLVHNT